MTREIAARNHWLQRFHPSSEGATRLICFPYAGGSATYYFPLSEALAPELEVFAVQYPGRQERHREKHLDNVGDLAGAIAAALSGWDGGPFAFFGHSMGAVVAFETARRLRAAGHAEPAHLFASGRRAPSRRRPDGIHQRDDQGIIADLLTMGATDPRLLEDEDIRAAIVSTVRADYRAIETYVPEPGASVGCPVTVLVGDSDPQTTFQEASAWRDHCGGEFDIRVFRGGHFYLDVCRSEVADVIRGSLATASGRIQEREMS